MLGFAALGQASLGANAGPVSTAHNPPSVGKAFASQYAAVAVCSNSVPGQASQMAYIVPSLDIAVPSAGAQSSLIAYVSVGYEYTMTAKPHGYTIRQFWGFPLLIQQGV